MFCRKCGTKFKENGIFCSTCGNGKTSPPQKINTPYSQEPTQHHVKKKGSSTFRSLGRASMGTSFLIFLNWGGPIIWFAANPPQQRGGLGIVDWAANQAHQFQLEQMINDASMWLTISSVLFFVAIFCFLIKGD